MFCSLEQRELLAESPNLRRGPIRKGLIENLDLPSQLDARRNIVGNEAAGSLGQYTKKLSDFGRACTSILDLQFNRPRSDDVRSQSCVSAGELAEEGCVLLSANTQRTSSQKTQNMLVQIERLPGSKSDENLPKFAVYTEQGA